jgi:preprotein translocase subunit Sss1
MHFLFDILNGILKSLRECNNELEENNNIIENNRKPSKDE